jgi:hypothetical protein
VITYTCKKKYVEKKMKIDKVDVGEKFKAD